VQRKNITVHYDELVQIRQLSSCWFYAALVKQLFTMMIMTMIEATIIISVDIFVSMER